MASSLQRLGNTCSYWLPTFTRASTLKTNLISCPKCGNLRILSNKKLFTQARNYDAFKNRIENGPSLQHFITNSAHVKNGSVNPEEDSVDDVPYVAKSNYSGQNRKVFFDVYGCQMNVNDTEIAWSILQENGFQKTTNIIESDVILIMTCSIRERAEDKIWNRLEYYKYLKRKRQSLPKSREPQPPVKIGILGCMAERLKQKIVEKEKLVDVVCGPDAYRDLPRMLALTKPGQATVNVLLSLEETYADVVPVRLNTNAPSAFVSIMRGCDNMCSYCIVPFTRGRERSRPITSIVDEIHALSDQGIREITLLGQNVNSYMDKSEIQFTSGCTDSDTKTSYSRGFSSVYKPKTGGRRFADLLDMVSLVDPEMRIRFTSPHPKDFPDEVLQLINERPNICKQIHLPAQSGSTAVLERMRRGYTHEAYLDLVQHIKNIVPGVALTSDFIAGFCGETEDDHQQSINLLKSVKYNFAFCFPYSMRQKTRAYHRLDDNVPQEVKDCRHMELINTFREESLKLNQQQIGLIQLVLIEGESKKSSADLAARNDANAKVIVPNIPIPDTMGSISTSDIQVADYIAVEITGATSQTLLGRPLYHTSLQGFYSQENTITQHCARAS